MNEANNCSNKFRGPHGNRKAPAIDYYKGNRRRLCYRRWTFNRLQGRKARFTV